MNLKKMWNNNKLTILFSAVILIILIAMIVLVYPLYSSKSGSKYGDRLEGIEEVKITDEQNDSIEKLFKDNDKVKNIKTHLSGRLYNVFITLNEEQPYDDIVELSDNMLDKLDEEQINYYDFQIFIKSTIGEDEKYVIGYKNSNSDNISWTNKTEVN